MQENEESVLKEIRTLHEKVDVVGIEVTNLKTVTNLQIAKLQVQTKSTNEKLEAKLNANKEIFAAEIKRLQSEISHSSAKKPILKCVGEVFYPKDGREQKTCRHYPIYDLHFVGYGVEDTYETYTQLLKNITTLDQCLKECVDYRRNNGLMWNICRYEGYCYVYKNGGGFIPGDSYKVQYRFAWPPQ